MKSRVLAFFVLPAALAVSLICFGGCFKQSVSDAVLAQTAPPPVLVNVCEGASRIPIDWVVTDESHNSSCEYRGSTTVTGRMLQLESDASAKNNLTPMTVCADADVPLGFVVTAFSKAPNKCSVVTQKPNAPDDQMVKTIQYVHP